MNPKKAAIKAARMSAGKKRDAELAHQKHG